MPAEWWFYHVEHATAEDAAPALLEKCLERKWRVVVAAEPDTLARLDPLLWTFKDDSFLPHAMVGPEAARQPILLHTSADPVNGARVALLMDGRSADPALFDRCMVLFNGGDEAVRTIARKQYQAAEAAGAVARYFQQGQGGAWTDKTPARKGGPKGGA
jgi:DNA polymerase III subunit chi